MNVSDESQEDDCNVCQRTCWLDGCGHCLWCQMQKLPWDPVARKDAIYDELSVRRNVKYKARRVFGSGAKEIFYFDKQTGYTWKFDREERTLRLVVSMHAQSSSTPLPPPTFPILPRPPLPPILDFCVGSPGCWEKYCDPKDERMWWWNDKTCTWFFEYGCWVKYRDPRDGRWWWWNDKSGEWFFEDKPCLWRLYRKWWHNVQSGEWFPDTTDHCQQDSSMHAQSSSTPLPPPTFPILPRPPLPPILETEVYL